MKSRKKKIFLKKAAVAIILIIFISITTVHLFYRNFLIFDVKETKMELIVSEWEMGVKIDNDALYFGKIPKGSSGYRYINLYNYDTKPHIIHIRTYGEFADWVFVNKNDFIIEPNKTETVEVRVFVPWDAKVGNYTGILRVEFLNKIF